MPELIELGDGVRIGRLEGVRVDRGVLAPGGFGVALGGDPLEVLPRSRLHPRRLFRRQMIVAAIRPRHRSLSLSPLSGVDRCRWRLLEYDGFDTNNTFAPSSIANSDQRVGAQLSRDPENLPSE
ncbi:hypothetical protein C4D60_Mb10t16060 [Musa balbisiana]|uniref:Uncharacterized protein n=1 Tax=Musa balbisiana TaxID=52838 RepID=A0A4S8IXJ9_MUSBA|nr:hypothetical protein C4D60_Mb10t16060 [Musa balbisiana]